MVPMNQEHYYPAGGEFSRDSAFDGVRVIPRMQAYHPDDSLVKSLYIMGDFVSGRHIVLGGVKRQVLNDMSWVLSSGSLACTAAVEDLKNSR